MKRKISVLLMAFLFILLLSGCSKAHQIISQTDTAGVTAIVEESNEEVEILPAEVPGYYKPNTIFVPTSPRTQAYANSKVVVDASNSANGYFTVTYTGSNPKIKVQIIKTGGTTYTYDLNAVNTFEVFPITEGNGNYTVKLFENVSGITYSQAFSQSVDVILANEFLPFLYPNQYVNFNQDSAVVSKAAEITTGITDELKIVEAVYTYVINNFTYDYNKAANVQSGYLPNVDSILSSKTGICFDYAAVMSSMLRSLNIPTKLVVGFTGSQYHAWIDVYTENLGWVASAIYFDGTNWKLMDPTFASTGKSNAAVLEYITNPANYAAKYIY